MYYTIIYAKISLDKSTFVLSYFITDKYRHNLFCENELNLMFSYKLKSLNNTQNILDRLHKIF